MADEEKVEESTEVQITRLNLKTPAYCERCKPREVEQGRPHTAGRTAHEMRMGV